jgi:hypothetical protein
VRAQLEAQKKQQNNLKRANLTNIAEKKLAMKKEIMAVADKQLGSLARPAFRHPVARDTLGKTVAPWTASYL